MIANNLKCTRLSSSTLILLANNIITAVIAFALTILISRGMGAVDFGRYATVMAWVLPLTLVADFGLNTLITRDVALQRSQASIYLQLSHPVRLTIGVLIVGGMWVLAPLLSTDAQVVTGLRVAILLAVIDAFFGSYTAVFRAWEIFWPILFLNSTYLTLQLSGAVLIIMQDGDVVTLLMAIVAADIVQLGLTWLYWRTQLHIHVPESGGQAVEWQHLIQRSYPFVIAGVLAMLQMRIMIILIERLADTSSAGWYAAAFRLVEAARMAPNALFVALFPRLTALSSTPEQFSNLLQRAAWGLILYSIGFGLAMWVAGDWMISLLFGDAFKPAGDVLTVLAWSLLPGNLRALLTLQHYAYGREQLVNYCLLIGLILQIVAALVFVPLYGLAASGWAVIIGESSLMICLATGSMIYRNTTS